LTTTETESATPTFHIPNSDSNIMYILAEVMYQAKGPVMNRLEGGDCVYLDALTRNFHDKFMSRLGAARKRVWAAVLCGAVRLEMIYPPYSEWCVVVRFLRMLGSMFGRICRYLWMIAIDGCSWIICFWMTWWFMVALEDLCSWI